MLKRKFTYWPFIEDADDFVYGPINDDTIAEVVVDFDSEEIKAPELLLPSPPEGCFYGLVGIETVEA